jgi:hypothetical protein
MKRDDPKRLKLQAARDAAGTKVEILTKGIAGLLENYYIREVEDLRPILDAVNVDLVEAVAAYEKATEAYRPFMSRRRVRTFRARKAA